jgi:integrase
MTLANFCVSKEDYQAKRFEIIRGTRAISWPGFMTKGAPSPPALFATWTNFLNIKATVGAVSVRQVAPNHCELFSGMPNGSGGALPVLPRRLKGLAYSRMKRCRLDQRLIADTTGHTPAQIRDHVILLLLAVYGFRSGEVAQLRLEDLDWDARLIHLYRSKSRRTQFYPLLPSVGAAIKRYLEQGRTASNRHEIFLTLKAPFRPLSPGCLYHLVSSLLRRLGITSRHRGPHSLRHACATRLVAEGFSLKQIGDHLGHRSAFATRIYAKVDLVGLREVARFDLGGI